jgi:hypothetical protein
LRMGMALRTGMGLPAGIGMLIVMRMAMGMGMGMGMGREAGDGSRGTGDWRRETGGGGRGPGDGGRETDVEMSAEMDRSEGMRRFSLRHFMQAARTLTLSPHRSLRAPLAPIGARRSQARALAHPPAQHGPQS